MPNPNDNATTSETPAGEEVGGKRGIVDTSFDKSTSPGSSSLAKRTPSNDNTAIIIVAC